MVTSRYFLFQAAAIVDKNNSGSSLKLRLERLLKATELAPKLTANNHEEEASLFRKYYENMTGDSTVFSKASLCKLQPSRFRFGAEVKQRGSSVSDSTAASAETQLLKEARAALLQRKSRQLLNSSEMQAIWHLLVAHRTPPDNPDGERLIDYEGYQKVRQLASPKCVHLLSPRLFFKLLQAGDRPDPLGRVGTDSLYTYILKKNWLAQTRIYMSLYDFSGHGYLRRSDLENYITDLMPTLPQLSQLDKLFHGYYVCNVVQKILFFLDPHRIDRVKICHILTSSLLDDLTELQDNSMPPSRSNWFSAAKTQSVYGMFLDLDKDANGLLSKSEFAAYGAGSLTQAFLDRLFQSSVTYDGEMDYKAFLDFLLAVENRTSPQSLAYFFRILDIDDCGAITAWTVNYFYRGLEHRLRQLGVAAPTLRDFQDEIFDLARPADPFRIKLSDLIGCGRGDVIVSILIDAGSFWKFENQPACLSEEEEGAPLMDGEEDVDQEAEVEFLI